MAIAIQTQNMYMKDWVGGLSQISSRAQKSQGQVL